jgi:hypothetical protein
MTDIKNKVLVPTLKCLELFYRQLYRLIIKEFIAGGYSSIPIGRIGNTEKYKVADLGNPDDYTIGIRFMTKTKREEIANITMSQSAKGEIPRSVRIREIMQVESPEKWEQELDQEEAELIDPAVKFRRKALSLIRLADKNPDSEEAEGQYIEAKTLALRGVEIIKQRKVASLTNPTQDITNPTPAKGNAQPMMELFGSGATRTGGDQSNNKENLSGSKI